MSDNRMIDTITTLAFSIFTNKGVYALLLGSGISRVAGIPTGWDITLDLLMQLSKTEGESIKESDLEKWFREKYRQEPDYSDIIGNLAHTEIERQNLLRGYFEPTEEDKSEKKKIPTKAHDAIARLITNGYIQVVVTTNFDRLLEQSLDNLGTPHNVLSTPEQMEGGIPLRHSGATILKIHGDYRSHKLKNTDKELSEYEQPINKILDQVFDEYGLIICGWSSIYDHALRKAIERSPNKRYSTYWTHLHISKPEGPTLELINRRDATTIEISGADQFFEGLVEKILSLENINATHPMSEKIAIATVKRYLPDPLAQIKLHDLIKTETDHVVSELRREEFTACSIQHGASPYTEKERIPNYEMICNRLLQLLCVMAYWGDERHIDLISKTIERIALAKPGNYNSYYPEIANAQHYPALLLFYAVGITRLSAGKYDFFEKFSSFMYNDNDYKEMAFIISMLPSRILKAMTLPQNTPTPIPASDYIFNLLREPLKEFIPDDAMYTTSIELFEYLKWVAVYYATQNNKSLEAIAECYFPYRFFAKVDYLSGDRVLLSEILANKIKREIERYGANWKALRDGFCGGDIRKIVEIIDSITNGVKECIKRNPGIYL